MTGGTGSVGTELVQRLLDEDYDRICVFSRDEFKQAEMRFRMPSDRLRWFIGDVRDKDRLKRAFEGVDTVIHAAALKRVEVGQYDAAELVKTNILGTLNVIEAAHDAGVKKVIGVSTDKACQPASAYGASKLMMEKVLLAANNASGEHGPRFCVTRFGNFAGSRGSVIPTWLSIDGPVPMTDPDCTRFWMTAGQACELILQAVKDMKGGETFMPTLRAFRLGDLAEAMGLETRIVGLGPEEQKHEFMFISSAEAPLLSIEELREFTENYRKTRYQRPQCSERNKVRGAKGCRQAA